MFNTRTIQTIAMTAAALCLSAVAGEAAAPTVTYTAAGTFATPPLRGLDMLKLAGTPFTVTVTASEATKPVKHTKTAAEYQGLTASLTFTYLGGSTETIFTQVHLWLVVGATGQPDLVQMVTAPYLGVEITARAAMPSGTITTPAIKPFTAPVTLNPTNVRVEYDADTAQFTVLGVASGTLTATAK